jgi:cell division protein FtsB
VSPTDAGARSRLPAAAARLAALAARLPRPHLPPLHLPRRRRPRRPSRVRRAVWGVVASVALVGALFGFVFPTRTYLAQRAAADTARERLEVLTAENEALERRIEQLGTPEEVEAIARRDYGLVRPGEEAYAVLPPPPPAVDLPDTWPFGRLAARLDRATTTTSTTAPPP